MTVAARPAERRGLGAAVLVGAIYAGLGIAASMIGGTPATVRLARWGAFLGSGLAFLAHVGFEVLGWRATPLRAAIRVGAGAALGGFLLAVSANVHELLSAADFRPRMLVAFIAWPLLTAVPAFLAALGLAAVLGRVRRGTGTSRQD